MVCQLCDGMSKKDWAYCEKCKPFPKFWGDGYLVLSDHGIIAKTSTIEGRDLIIKYMNSYGELVEAAKMAYRYGVFTSGDEASKARALLDKVIKASYKMTVQGGI